MDILEIKKAVNNWISIFSSADSAKICACYDTEGVLFGTLSPVVRDNPALIAEYFDNTFKLSNLSVDLVNSKIRLFDDIAICSGLYDFSWRDGNKTNVINARFTIVYQNIKGKWLIIEHHSSALPLVKD